MDESKVIEEYFQKTAEDFDVFYSNIKGPLRRTIDFIFRRSMHKRFELTLKECEATGAKRIIDVGCGSGRYSVALAKKGAEKVVGIDFSENMLILARELSRRNKVERICQFIRADFLKYSFDEVFDVSIAIGVLEYFKDPKALLKKMAEVAQKKVIFSLPVKWTFRSLLRKIRLALKGYPVYFYTKSAIERMLKESGLNNYCIIKIDRDYFVSATLEKGR